MTVAGRSVTTAIVCMLSALDGVRPSPLSYHNRRVQEEGAIYTPTKLDTKLAKL